MRKYQEIKGYDYKSYDEFLNHSKKMKEKGWTLIKDIFGGALDPQEMDDDRYKYTACYIKSPML